MLILTVNYCIYRRRCWPTPIKSHADGLIGQHRLAYHAWSGGPGYDSDGVRNLRRVHHEIVDARDQAERARPMGCRRQG